ncbi:winged helix-turn-helix domain-containing protein [Aliivibrio salmonicida]|uniref:winged helix-turn-helix domain-containing protein n=1 Tax=Aliivibrio salmonicida TaxID=40269 RepID=UPI003D0C5C40
MAIYQINDRVFNTLDRTITGEVGDVRKLSRSEVYLLAYLIENQGKTIDKMELMAIGWPKKIVVVNSLTVAVSNLRKSLEDPNIISSNKGIGYTFSQQAAIIHNAIDELEDEEIVKDYSHSHSHKLNILFYLSVLTFLICTFFAINWFFSYVPKL